MTSTGGCAAARRTGYRRGAALATSKSSKRAETYRRDDEALLRPAGARVGAVDRFQGQEADVVVYTMASSSGEGVPHGLEFLLSSRLLEVSSKTIDQMWLANALCRFLELAGQRSESAPLT